MSNENLVMVSDTDFEEKVINSKMIAPFLTELADEFQGKVKIAKLNVDQNVQTASRFGVRSIPTLILFENGQQKEMTVGADPTKIRQMVNAAA